MCTGTYNVLARGPVGSITANRPSYLHHIRKKASRQPEPHADKQTQQ